MLSFTVETLYKGAVIERVNVELEKVLQNILDPNTKAKAKRSVLLKITLTPSESREIAEVEIATESKLAPMTPLETAISLGMDRKGTVDASELGPDSGYDIDIETGGKHIQFPKDKEATNA